MANPSYIDPDGSTDTGRELADIAPETPGSSSGTGDGQGSGAGSAAGEADDLKESSEDGEDSSSVGDPTETDGEESDTSGEDPTDTGGDTDTSGGDSTDTGTETGVPGDDSTDTSGTDTETSDDATTGDDDTTTGVGDSTDDDTTDDGTTTDDDPPGFCGDGIKQPDEMCDGLDFGGQDCLTFGQNGDASGELTCTDSCFIVAHECLEPLPGEAFVHMHACDEDDDCMPPADWPDQGEGVPGSLCYYGRCIQWSVGPAIATADVVQGPGLTCAQVEEHGMVECPSAPFATCDEWGNPEQEVCCYPWAANCVTSNECCGTDRSCFDIDLSGDTGVCFTDEGVLQQHPGLNIEAARL